MNKLRYSKNGFTLIEVLVTLIVILLGLLGIAALQAKSQQAQLEAYQRSQAIILLNDMANRINANREQADLYAITDITSGDPFLGTGDSGTPALGSSVVDADLKAWDGALEGAAETRSGKKVGAMIGARGCISRIVTTSGPTDQYVISIAWQGLNETREPDNNNTCAQSSYVATEKKKWHVVSITIQIANLKNLN